ncbi:hypothetical protein A0256_19080 [Mucilaginibacter sp. PAMC 26640]|nr:hypothetical protein A0256_19080 [Mucilaginibacter sp. PAMC 26640]
MKRLHSHITYPIVFFNLAVDAFATYLLFDNYDTSLGLLYLVVLMNFIFLLGAYVSFITYKRVYLNDSKLYIYDLYSKTPYILPLTDLRGVKKEMRVFDMLFGVYKLDLAVEGSYNDYTFTFIKNKLIGNLSNYI